MTIKKQLVFHFLHGFGDNKVEKYRLFARMSELLAKKRLVPCTDDCTSCTKYR